MNNHRSEYGVIQTIRFMIRQAAKEAPAVLVWLVVDAILALILQLLELYVTPVLLRDIEEQIALKEQCDMLNAKGIKRVSDNYPSFFRWNTVTYRTERIHKQCNLSGKDRNPHVTLQSNHGKNWRNILL